MVSHLLPAPDAAPACSAHTRAIAVRPMGTGLRLDRIVLLAVAAPWPKPALGHEMLKPAAAALTASRVPSRLFAAEPTAEAPAGTIDVYERSGLDWRHWRRRATSPEDAAAEMARLADQELGVSVPGAAQVTTPTMFVCTQGSHDLCCGVEGEALAATIERARPELAVRRVSHTGGHRFAPTLLALPAGTMWAWCDLDLVDRIAQGRETGDDLVGHCRGWLGATIGAEQVAELAARRSLGAPPALPASIQAPANDGAPWRVTFDQRTVAVEVSIGRDVPTIACEALGGEPVKTAREFAFRIVEEPPS